MVLRRHLIVILCGMCCLVVATIAVLSYCRYAEFEAAHYIPHDRPLAWPLPEPNDVMWSMGYGSLEDALLDRQGQHLITSGSGIHVWDARSGELRARFAQDQRLIDAIALSPDGETLAAARFDGEIQLWKWREPQLLKRLAGHEGAVIKLAFSPCGAYLASTGENHSVRLWDRQAGKQLRQIETGRDHTVDLAFSPDSSILAIAHGTHNLSLWSVPRGRHLRDLSGHDGAVHAVAFFPNGKHLASGSADGTVILWDLEAWMPLQRLYFEDAWLETWPMAISSCGRYLCAARSHLRVYDLEDDKWVHEVDGQHGSSEHVAFAGEASVMLTIGLADSIVTIWEVDAWMPVTQIASHSPGGHLLTFTPDGDYLVEGGGFAAAMRIWDVESRRLDGYLRDPDASVWALDLSPCGQFMASLNGRGYVRIWDLPQRRALREFAAHDGGIGHSVVSYAPDGATVLTIGDDGHARAWDAKSGQPVFSFDNAVPATAAGWSLDSNQIVIGHEDGSLVVWRLDGTQAVPVRKIQQHTQAVRSVCFSPDDAMIVSGGRDGRVILWSNSEDEPRWSHREHGRPLYQVAFARDGALVLSLGGDGHIRAWDAASDRSVGRFGHVDSGMQCFAVSPTGDYLVATGFHAIHWAWRLPDLHSGDVEHGE